MIRKGCIFLSSSLPASLINSLAKIMQAVTPSPQLFSWLFAKLTKALAAGCLTNNSEIILAESLVTAAVPSVLYIILSRPLGPKVPLMILPKAIAASTNFLVTAGPLVTDVVGLVILTGALPDPSPICAIEGGQTTLPQKPTFTEEVISTTRLKRIRLGWLSKLSVPLPLRIITLLGQ